MSRLVKRVGDQQKELVLELSQQLARHNEMMDKALEKQARMKGKIDNIEAELRKKESIEYERKLEQIEQLKKLERRIRWENDNEDDEGFASCEEDEQHIKGREETK